MLRQDLRASPSMKIVLTIKLRISTYLPCGDKPENYVLRRVDPPLKNRGFTGEGGKGMDIFFNFRPMIMIQNENLLYKDQRIYFQHHHVRARALSRAKKSIKLSFLQKSHFSTIFK